MRANTVCSEQVGIRREGLDSARQKLVYDHLGIANLVTIRCQGEKTRYDDCDPDFAAQ
jgi:hypothetical protein